MSATPRRNATVFPYRGKWRVQYLDAFGKSRTMTAENRQDAYLKLAEIEGQVRGGYLNLSGSQRPTFGQWLDYWLGVRKPELSPTTWIGYEMSVRIWLKPLMGELRLDTITPRQIQDLYAYLMETHELKSGTIRRMHSLLSSVFGFAKLQGVISASVIDSVKQPRLERKTIEVFSTQELETIFKSLSQKPPAAHLRWLLALRYGMRQGEVLGLKFSDFDLVRKTLKIQRAVNSLPGQGVVELPTKSQNSTREIPIDSQVVQLISQMDGKGWLYPADNGMPIDATVDARRWRALLAGCGVRHLPLHSARHTVATHLMQEGTNPRVVQMLLGHSSPAYTLAVYVHPSMAEIASAIDKSTASIQANQRAIS
jgi:integrase